MAEIDPTIDEDLLQNYVPDEKDTHKCTKVHGYCMVRAKPGFPYWRMFNLHQFAAWFAVVASAAFAASLHLPMLPHPMNIVFLLLMPGGLVCSVLFSLVTSLTQPADPAVFIRKRMSFEEYKASALAWPRAHPGVDQTQLLFCSYCHVWVNRDVKHCHFCNKCVRDFDHHCKILNCCVGGTNYRFFATYAGLTSLLLVIEMVLGAYLFIRSFVDESAYEVRFESVYDNSNRSGFWGWRVMLVVCFVLQLPFLLFLGNLLRFHTWLQFKTETRYSSVPVVLSPDWKGTLQEVGLLVNWERPANNVEDVLPQSQVGQLGVMKGWHLYSVTWGPDDYTEEVNHRDDWRRVSEQLHTRLSYDVDVVLHFTSVRPMTTFDYLISKDEDKDAGSEGTGPVPPADDAISPLPEGRQPELAFHKNGEPEAHEPVPIEMDDKL
ncbi:Protein S-acyltransferase 21 [Diplonema papillatum]|nr:Protein S-acyltransferase 21 [Diplonema papillatum]